MNEEVGEYLLCTSMITIYLPREERSSSAYGCQQVLVEVQKYTLLASGSIAGIAGCIATI